MVTIKSCSNLQDFNTKWRHLVPGVTYDTLPPMVWEGELSKTLLALDQKREWERHHVPHTNYNTFKMIFLIGGLKVVFFN